MATLIDTSLWIDFTRHRSPKGLKQFIAPFILDSDAYIAEPVAFEVLRHATKAEFQQLTQQFATFPMLSTPADAWGSAAAIGRACRDKNFVANSLDLLITAVALHHGAELITFDSDFTEIASASSLKARLLIRPSS